MNPGPSLFMILSSRPDPTVVAIFTPAGIIALGRNSSPVYSPNPRQPSAEKEQKKNADAHAAAPAA